MQRLHALDHLRAQPQLPTRDPMQGAPTGVWPSPGTPAKSYRIILDSRDRVAGRPADCIFDLGDLRGAWGLPESLDGRKVRYEGRLETFVLSSPSVVIETPVRILAANGFPAMSETFDSGTGGPSTLIGVAQQYAVPMQVLGQAPFGLDAVPTGRVNIQLRDLNPSTAAAFDAATDTFWYMVISIRPQAP